MRKAVQRAPLLGSLGCVLAVFLCLGGPQSAAAQDAESIVRQLEESCGKPRACLREAFVYEGKAIHPLIVKALAGLPADGRAVVTAVDLLAAQGANQFCCGDSFEVSLDEAGRIGASIDLVETFSAAQQPKEDCPEGCWFSYRFIGSTRNDVQVVVTWEKSGGGSTFSALLFLKPRKALIFDGERWSTRLQLTAIGKMNLVAEAETPVTIDGGTVHVGDREIPVAN
ncbi:hypothetical protein [Pelagibius marinus]|uniref:hypothetical protein n=1 Tax=Pelagibius marinus TaxID=2762760 RepID=UPI0018722B29|nr:hypothetical protein [Pelagibius marinus]